MPNLCCGFRRLASLFLQQRAPHACVLVLVSVLVLSLLPVLSLVAPVLCQCLVSLSIVIPQCCCFFCCFFFVLLRSLASCYHTFLRVFFPSSALVCLIYSTFLDMLMYNYVPTPILGDLVVCPMLSLPACLISPHATLNLTFVPHLLLRKKEICLGCSIWQALITLAKFQGFRFY